MPLLNSRRAALFVLQCQVVVPMLLAPVNEEPAGEAPDLPPIDEELERELNGREEVEPPVAIEVPAPGEPTSDERRHHGLTHLPYQPWCNICVRACGRENRDVSWSQNQPGTPVIQCDCCFLKTEEDAPMVTVLVTTQCTNRWFSFLLRRKETEIRLQDAVWPHSRGTSDIPK